MIVLAFKDGEVYRCDINILFLPQLMSLHKKNTIKLHSLNGQKLKWKKCLKSWPKAIHSSGLSGACVAVDVGEGGCSLISVWKFLKDLSRGEAGHRVINM